MQIRNHPVFCLCPLQTVFDIFPTNQISFMCLFEGVKASCTHSQTQKQIEFGQISAHSSAQRSPSSRQMLGVLQLTENTLILSYPREQRGLIPEELHFFTTSISKDWLLVFLKMILDLSVSSTVLSFIAHLLICFV